MTLLDAVKLEANDGVLMECQIDRYQPKGSSGWETFKTSFKICNIVRLWAATGTVPEDEESEDEDLQRAGTDDEFEGF